MKVDIREKESGQVIYESEGDTYNLTENTALYSYLRHSVKVDLGKIYQLEITSDAPENSGIGLYCVTTSKGEEALVSPKDDERGERRSLQMCITGVE